MTSGYDANLIDRNTRRLALCLAVGLGLGFAVSAYVRAQDFPNKPLRIVVPYPPGGAPDSVARLVAQVAGASLGQPVAIDNRPGAGGVLAVQETIKSNPDGYTLGALDSGQWAIYPALRPGAYDPAKDVAPVAQLMTGAFFIVVDKALPAKDLPEFISLMKANPGKYSYATAGTGSIHHLLMETFKSALGLDVVHVPYKGSTQSVAAVLGGQAAIVIAGPANTASQVASGQLRLIGATSKRRSKFAPNIPALSELGGQLSEFDFQGDMGIFAAAGTPRAIVDKLSGALKKAAESPEVVSRMEALGAEPQYASPDQLANLVRADVARYARAVKISGAKLD